MSKRVELSKAQSLKLYGAFVLIVLALLVSLGQRVKAEDALVVNVCGTLPLAYSPGSTRQPTVDINGKTCTNAASGGGAATLAAGAVSAGAYVAGALVDGADTTFGALADVACATDNGTCSLQALVKRTNQRITTLNTTLGSPAQAGAATPAGTNNIGNVGSPMKQVCVDPGTTNNTYSANMPIGPTTGGAGVLQFANLFTATGHGHIQSVSVTFATVQTVGFELVPMHGLPSGTAGYTDHVVAALNGATDFADASLVDGGIQLANPDSRLGTLTNYSLSSIGQSYVTGGTTGYFVLVPTATTASLGATSSAVHVCVTVDFDP